MSEDMELIEVPNTRSLKERAGPEKKSKFYGVTNSAILLVASIKVLGGHRHYVGWRPPLLGWRPLLFGCKPLLN